MHLPPYDTFETPPNLGLPEPQLASNPPSPTRHLKHPAAPQTFLGFARAVASATNGSSGQ